MVFIFFHFCTVTEGIWNQWCRFSWSSFVFTIGIKLFRCFTDTRKFSGIQSTCLVVKCKEKSLPICLIYLSIMCEMNALYRLNRFRMEVKTNHHFFGCFFCILSIADLLMFFFWLWQMIFFRSDWKQIYFKRLKWINSFLLSFFFFNVPNHLFRWGHWIEDSIL